MTGIEQRIGHLVERSTHRLKEVAQEWTMFVSWVDVFFASFPVPVAQLRPLVPPELELDTRDGSAWVSILPFRAEDMHFRGLPAMPGQADFYELNLRTYVTHGGVSAIYFLSLDTPARLADLIGKYLFAMPFFHATQTMTERDGVYRFESRRDARDAPEAVFAATWRPLGTPAPAVEGSLTHFLAERYALLVTGKGGQLYRGDIAHPVWQVQEVEATIETNTLAQAAGLTLPDVSPHMGFSPRTDSIVWPLEKVAD